MPAKRRHGGEVVAQSTNCNLYEILQVPKNATQRDIVQSYHQRALKLHPDKQGGDKDMFQKLAQAYEILVNPTTRDQYHMSLLHHRSNDGMLSGASTDTHNSHTSSVHPLTHFPDEMVQLLLVVPLQGWQRLLRGFGVDQLDGLLKALTRLTKSGRKPVTTRKQEGANPVGDLHDLHLMHLQYRSYSGMFQACLTLHGFDICTQYTKLEPVAAFYHTAIVELKEQVSQCSQGNQDFDAAMKQALDKLAALSFACPFIFRFRRRVGGKWMCTPQVTDLGLALAMRQEAQDVQDRPSTIKRLTDKWRRAAEKSSEAYQTLRQRKAVELKGYITALQDSLRLPRGPIVRLRRDGKQPPDVGLKVLFLGRLAANLQLETADLESQLASPAGQRVLLSFFEQNQSNRTLSLPLDCPYSTFGSLDESQKRAVLQFLGLVDLARLGATQKQCRQDVQTSLENRCTDGLELTPQDFSEDEMCQISQVVGFLHQRCLAEVITISFSDELPASVMSHGLLWATLSAMSNLKVVFLHRVHALCPPADVARKFAVQVGLWNDLEHTLPMLTHNANELNPAIVRKKKKSVQCSCHAASSTALQTLCCRWQLWQFALTIPTKHPFTWEVMESSFRFAKEASEPIMGGSILPFCNRCWQTKVKLWMQVVDWRKIH